MKKHAAISHQSGGCQAYLPIKSPRAKASAAQSKGARAAGDIAAICVGTARLPKAVKCLARCNASAKAGVDPVGKVVGFPSCSFVPFVVGLFFYPRWRQRNSLPLEEPLSAGQVKNAFNVDTLLKPS